MATVIFAVPPMASPIYASLKLAKELHARGDRIFYLGVPDSRDFVAPNEIDFLPVFSDWFPKGYLDSRTDDEGRTNSAWISRAKKRAKQFSHFFESLISGSNADYQQTLALIKPDLVVIPSCTYYSIIWALLTHDSGVKGLYLSYTFGCSPNSGHPPVTTGLTPGASVRSRFQTKFAWETLFLKRKLSENVFSTLGLSLNWSQCIRRLARKCKYPVGLMEFKNLTAPKLQYPELFLCPRELDFPGEDPTLQHYGEASIDLRRKETDFPWEKLADSKPIVYCSLGTLQYMSREKYKDFFRKTLVAASRRRDRQWVISVGSQFNVEEFAPIPKNVVLVNRAPQLELLKKASVMISHGGMNSVKESIYFGVPMLVFPLGFDEPGNAARIVYHRLGLSGDIQKTSVEQILELLDRIDADPSIRIRTAQMSSTFRKSESDDKGVRFIEGIAGRGLEQS